MSGVLAVATGTRCLTASVFVGEDWRPGYQEVQPPAEPMVGFLAYLNGQEAISSPEAKVLERELRVVYWQEARRVVQRCATYHSALAVPKFPPEGLRASPFASIAQVLVGHQMGQPLDQRKERLRAQLLEQDMRHDLAAGTGREEPMELSVLEDPVERRVSNHPLLPVDFFHDGLRQMALSVGLVPPWLDDNREVYFRCPLCRKSDPTNRRYGEFHCRRCMKEPIKEADLVVAWNVGLNLSWRKPRLLR